MDPCEGVEVPEKLRLKVMESLPRDIGKARARLAMSLMAKIGLKPGDALLIKGKKEAAATAWPSDPDETPPEAIRLDGSLRRNVGAALNDVVEVSRSTVKPASSIILAASSSNVNIDSDFESFVKNRMKGMPIVEGNTISIVVLGNPMSFMVLKTSPRGIVTVTDSTSLHVKVGTAEVPSDLRITYDDIGGLGQQLRKLREIVELPLRQPELFNRLGIEPPRGVLLYGPPGCGKTMIAKALATESQANIIVVKGPEILSKWVGESEKGIREIFRKAKASAPCIVFFDEIDSIGKARTDYSEGWTGETVLSQLLTEIDSLYSGENIFVVGATNRPDILDAALLRPGRLGLLLYVPPPDEKSRLSILKIKTASMPLASDVDLQLIARLSNNYTGADLDSVCRQAALTALKRSSDKVTAKDFETALATVRPTFTPEMHAWYKEIEKKLTASMLRSKTPPPYA